MIRSFSHMHNILTRIHTHCITSRNIYKIQLEEHLLSFPLFRLHINTHAQPFSTELNLVLVQDWCESQFRAVSTFECFTTKTLLVLLYYFVFSIYTEPLQSHVITSLLVWFKPPFSGTLNFY